MVFCGKDILNNPVKAGDTVVYCEHIRVNRSGMRLCTGRILKVTDFGITVEKDNQRGFKFVKEFVLIKKENRIDRKKI